MSNPGEQNRINVKEIRQFMAQKEGEEAAKAMETARKLEAEQAKVREEFMKRDIHPDVWNRLRTAVHSAAEHGKSEFMVIKFSSDLCTDGGRAINNADPDWPNTLTGFAKKAYDFFEKELKPQGFKARVEVLDYPKGIIGDIGLFLMW
jgi:hypothetical protein